MTTSADSVSTVQQNRTVGSWLTRYDVQLCVIPLAFLAGLLTAVLAAVPLEIALLGPSLVGLAVLADGLFLNPPDGRSRE